jgi:hypothetical protein
MAAVPVVVSIMCAILLSRFLKLRRAELPDA